MGKWLGRDLEKPCPKSCLWYIYSDVSGTDMFCPGSDMLGIFNRQVCGGQMAWARCGKALPEKLFVVLGWAAYLLSS